MSSTFQKKISAVSLVDQSNAPDIVRIEYGFRGKHLSAVVNGPGGETRLWLHGKWSSHDGRLSGMERERVLAGIEIDVARSFAHAIFDRQGGVSETERELPRGKILTFRPRAANDNDDDGKVGKRISTKTAITPVEPH